MIAGGDDPYTPAAQLVEREATLLYYPASQTLPPDNYDELDAALDRCRRGLIQTYASVDLMIGRVTALADGETVAVVSKETEFFRSPDRGSSWPGP